MHIYAYIYMIICNLSCIIYSVDESAAYAQMYAYICICNASYTQ
jgi:hypothetical protein